MSKAMHHDMYLVSLFGSLVTYKGYYTQAYPPKAMGEKQGEKQGKNKASQSRWPCQLIRCCTSTYSKHQKNPF